MPDNVDERVVEMRIDNRQFVNGAEQTIGILDRLKEALNFSNNKDNGFDDLQRSASRVNLSGISDSLDVISNRFTTMGLIGQRVIQNLTDSVSRYVMTTVRGLTVAPMYAGFDKYESILRSTQTIMSATRNEIIPENFGSQLEYVNNQMDRLAWYTDETSYNLSDMVSNIAKFTNVGITLDSAATDMMGVTNAAASAGATAAEASRAMYNFAQAIGTGAVKLQDWRSIETANMATMEFKQVIMDSAVQLGHLKKEADGTYKILKGAGKGKTVNSENFASTLQYGWFTGGVLEKSLQKYGEYSRRLGTVMDNMGLSDAGLTSTDVMETVDKISSGAMTLEDWQKELSESMEVPPSMDALQYAFDLLTNNEDALKKKAAELGEEYNGLSEDEFELSKRSFLLGQQYRTFGDVLSATKDAVSTGWMKTMQLIIGNAEQATEVWTAVGDVFNEIFAEGAARRNAILKWWNSPGEGIKSGRDSFLAAISNMYNAIRALIDPIREAFNNVFSWGTAKKAGEKLRELTEAFERFTSKLKISKTAGEGMTIFFTKIFGAIKKFLGVFKPIGKAIGNVIVRIKDFAEIFFESFASGDFDKKYFLSRMSWLFKKIKENAGEAWESVKRFADSLKDIPVLGTIINAVKSLFSFISKAFGHIGDFFSGRSVFDVLKEKIESIRTFLSPVFDWIVEKYNAIRDKVTELFSGDGLGLDKILKIFAGLAALRVGKGLFDWAKWDFTLITEPLQNVIGFFGDLDDAVWGFVNQTRIESLKKLAVALLILAAALVVLSLVDSDKLAVSLAALAGGLVELVGTLAALKFIKPKGFVQIASLLIALSVSILIFAAALKVLSTIDQDKLVDALGAAFFMLAMVFAFVAAVSLLKVKPRVVSGIISLAIAMLIFSGVIYILGSIPYKKLEQGLIALAVALVIVAAAMLVLSTVGGAKMLAIGIGMVFLAGAILILAGAVALLSFINIEKATNGLIILAGAMLIVAAAVLIMPATLPLIGAGLILVAVAIGLLAATLAVLSALNVTRLLEALLVVTATLVVLAITLTAMVAAIPGALALLVASVAFVVLAGALIVLSVAFKLLASAPLASIAGGLALVGLALVVFSVGLLAMTVGIVGAFALIVAAGGLVVLAVALNMMKDLPLAAIAGGLTLLGLSFILLGAGSMVLGLAAPGLILGAIAIGLLGLSLLPMTYALKQFSEIDFDTIVNYLMLFGGTAGVLALLTPVLGPLALAIGAFGVACLAAGEGINLAGSGFVKIADSMKSIGDAASTITSVSVLEILKDSKQFVDAGKAIVDNIVIGIYGAQSSALDALHFLIEALKVSIASDESFTMSPVITPVVDLSNVEASSEQIKSMLSGPRQISGNGPVSSGVDSSLASILKNMTASETNNYYQDTYTINVYPSEGQSEEEIANYVIDYIVRKGVALG